MANYYLEKGDNVVFLTTESSPEDIEKRGKDIGIDLQAHSKNLYYVDCYSWSLRQPVQPSTQNRNVVKISSPESLNEIIVKVERIMGIFNDRIKLIAHSISPFFLHNEDKEVTKFVQLLVTRIREEGSFFLSALQEGVHSPSTVNTLSYLVDGKIEMRFFEGALLERQIRAHHLKKIPANTVWKTFTLDKSGIKIKE
jgi:KaiC/GvpD/RAD55 family RecA-like ATPase